MGSAAPADTVAGIRISNPQRVIDATTGLTKLDLVRYYERFAEAMLPHLRRRPVALLRAPDGLGGEMFFQKHVASSRLPGMKQLDPSLDPGHPPLMEIDTVEALIGAVQMNIVEFHTWNGTLDAKGSIDRPDRMTFDLDPGEGIAWKQMVEATRLTRALLDELRLRSFLKTSGGKGLHVVVPLERHDDWDTVRAFSKAVVEHLARTLPGPLRRQERAEQPGRPHLRRLPAQRPRRHDGGGVLGACASRPGRVGAAALGAARKAAAQRPVEHSRRCRRRRRIGTHRGRTTPARGRPCATQCTRSLRRPDRGAPCRATRAAL